MQDTRYFSPRRAGRELWGSQERKTFQLKYEWPTPTASHNRQPSPFPPNPPVLTTSPWGPALLQSRFLPLPMVPNWRKSELDWLESKRKCTLLLSEYKAKGPGTSPSRGSVHPTLLPSGPDCCFSPDSLSSKGFYYVIQYHFCEPEKNTLLDFF